MKHFNKGAKPSEPAQNSAPETPLFKFTCELDPQLLKPTADSASFFVVTNKVAVLWTFPRRAITAIILLFLVAITNENVIDVVGKIFDSV